MPPGDLLTRDGEYQYGDRLFNGAAILHDAGYMIEDVEGLFGSPDVRTNDIPRQSDHGVISGQEYLGGRTITLDLSFYGSTKADFDARLRTMAARFNAINPTSEFAYQRNGVKKFLYAKARRSSFPTKDHGVWLCEGSAQLFAPDPRHYAIAETTVSAQINATFNNVALVLNNLGDFWTWAKFEIDGPVTDPRIANAQDANRQIKIDHVVNAGQLMVIDQAQKLVTVAGVDVFSSVRTDNQWIRIMPGVNNLTFSRNGVAGTSVIRGIFRSAWSG